MLPRLVGDGLAVPCLDGRSRPYVNLDCAASTSALHAVAESRVRAGAVVRHRRLHFFDAFAEAAIDGPPA
jgi:hypothetical protein